MEIDKSSNKVYTMYIPSREELSMLITKIQKWGNSQGIRIPKSIMDSMNWKNDDELSISTEQNKLIIEKISSKKRKNIRELFEGYNGKYEPIDIDWGKPEGSEIW